MPTLGQSDENAPPPTARLQKPAAKHGKAQLSESQVEELASNWCVMRTRGGLRRCYACCHDSV